MPWFRVDDGFGSSRQVMQIPKRQRAAAIGLWTLAGAWSAKELTDGFVPDYMLPELSGTAKLAGELVACGLWETRADGFAFKVWSRYQPTAEEVRSKRQDDAERKRTKRRNGAGQFEKSTTSEDAEMSARTNVGVHAESDASPKVSPSTPTRPDPSLPIEIAEDVKVAPSTTDNDGFDEFWTEYPKKSSKGQARTAFAKARKAVSLETLVEGAKAYREMPGRDDKYTKNASTWLNGECWADEMPAARPKTNHLWQAD